MAQAPNAQAMLSDIGALIASLELALEKLKRELHPSASAPDQLQLEERAMEATEDEAAAQGCLQDLERAFVHAQRPVREPWSEDIERERVVIDPPVACACCGGSHEEFAVNPCRVRGLSSLFDGCGLPPRPDLVRSSSLGLDRGKERPSAGRAAACPCGVHPRSQDGVSVGRLRRCLPVCRGRVAGEPQETAAGPRTASHTVADWLHRSSACSGRARQNGTRLIYGVVSREAISSFTRIPKLIRLRRKRAAASGGGRAMPSMSTLGVAHFHSSPREACAPSP